MLDSVRTRLTLWYVGVLALVLLTFSIGVHILLAHNLQQRLDTELHNTIVTLTEMIERERAEGETSSEAAKSVLEEVYAPLQTIFIYDSQGQLAANKPAVTGAALTLSLPLAANISDNVSFATLPIKQNDKAEMRVARQAIHLKADSSPYFIIVAQPLESLTAELILVRKIFYLVVPLALLLAGAGGWLLARKSLAPVVEMSAQARQLSAENLNERLPVANPRDELGQLAATFNDLLGRLNSSFERQRQFMTDASHELRTPLYVARTAAEVTLEQPARNEAEYRDALAMIAAQTQRLTRIVEDMFTLARADAGQRELLITDFYLDELMTETSRAVSVLAQNKGINFSWEIMPNIQQRGDEELLRQMLLNLLDNAIKYTPAGGSIHLSLASTNSGDEIVVTDTGIGIPAAAQPHIFDRFYRVDKARTRTEEGNGSGTGLGLAIARWIAEAHQGSLVLRRSDESGSVFVVILPNTFHAPA